MEQKIGEGIKGFKKRQQTGSRGGCLKKGVDILYNKDDDRDKHLIKVLKMLTEK